MISFLKMLPILNIHQRLPHESPSIQIMMKTYLNCFNSSWFPAFRWCVFPLDLFIWWNRWGLVRPWALLVPLGFRWTTRFVRWISILRTMSPAHSHFHFPKTNCSYFANYLSGITRWPDSSDSWYPDSDPQQ